MTIYTIGHGTLEADKFTSLLRGAGIETLVDVRSYPSSRHTPHFGREAMEQWLPDAGIAYWWLSCLGGRRKPSGMSRHMALRHESFRAYADHMETDGFVAGINELIEIADRPTAYMCCESVYWKCHRRMISDYLTMARGIEVLHIMHDGRLRPHVATDGVRAEGDGLVYDVGATPMLNLQPR